MRLLPSHQISRKSLENLRRLIQSSASLPSHIHPKVQIDKILPFWMWLQCRCHPSTMPNNPLTSGYCLHINSCGNHSRTRTDTSNQAKPALTPPKEHINQTSPFWMQLWHRCHPLTMPNNSSPSGFCLHINSCENCLRTCKDASNQARAFPHTYILRYTSIKHCHVECNCSVAAIHQQCQTISQHQAIASTSILAEIARELAQAHPIKHEPSLIPPKTHINQTSPFRMW